MSEIHLETWKQKGILYKNPSCSCYVYEHEGISYRVFRIEQEQLQKSLISLCMGQELLYSFYEGSFCLIEPYKEAISLAAWLQNSPDIQERIRVGRNLVFELMKENLPERLCDLILDLYSIGITSKEEIVLFFNPNFSHLQHPQQKNCAYRTSHLVLEILSQGKEIRRMRRYQDPSKYLEFVRKSEHKDYHSYDQLMNDLVYMEEAFEKKTCNWSLIIRIICILMAGICLLALCAIGIYKYIEWSERTYNGLPRIGEERMDP